MTDDNYEMTDEEKDFRTRNVPIHTYPSGITCQWYTRGQVLVSTPIHDED